MAAFAGIEAITVPLPVIPDTATLYVAGPPVTTAVVAPAVPLKDTSVLVKPVTDSEKTTVKLMGEVPVGSAWAPAWSMVTVGAGASITIALFAPQGPAAPRDAKVSVAV